MLRQLSILCALFACVGCDRQQQADALGPSDSKSIAMTVECLEPVADGTCNKKTCKKDDKSDCQDFGIACIKSNHQYDGTKNGGTCTRVKPQ